MVNEGFKEDVSLRGGCLDCYSLFYIEKLQKYMLFSEYFLSAVWF